MSAVGPYLRKRGSGYLYWCPGCNHSHYLNVHSPERPQWQYNGQEHAPTFSPSVRIFIPAAAATEHHPGRAELTLCHHFVRDGMIEFLSDCDHELKSQTVPMVPALEVVDYSWGDD